MDKGNKNGEAKKQSVQIEIKNIKKRKHGENKRRDQYQNRLPLSGKELVFSGNTAEATSTRKHYFI